MQATVRVEPAETLPEALAALLEEEAARAIAARGRFALALTGGSVATSCYPRLARARLDWARTELFFGDERAVPPDDPESNYGLARRLLIEPAAVPAARVHRMAADGPDLAAAAAVHERELLAILGGPPRLDACLLGVGPDGHVCSLFPGHPAASEERRWVAPVEGSPKPPPRRLTLTFPALRAAELLVAVALGEGKAAALHASLDDERAHTPLALALRGARRALVLLDPAAASLLRGRPGA